MVKTLETLREKDETLRKMVVITKRKHNVLAQSDIIIPGKLRRESADADVLPVASCLSKMRVDLLQTSLGTILLVELVWQGSSTCSMNPCSNRPMKK